MKQTAQGLAALGRGPDTELVHMAPGEVQSLQALAQKHGGSLTINPATGLPEAGFLSSILPMVLGAGLAATGVGAPMAALLVGGGYGAATGSLRKGLMAGLGAYGGTSLGEGLARAGMESAASTELAKDAAYKTAQDTMQSQAATLGQNALPYTPEGFAAQAKDIVSPVTGMQNAAFSNAQNAYANATPFENLKTMGSGISSLGSEAGRNAFMEGVGGNKGLMYAGLAASAPMMETTTKQPEFKTDKDMGQRYSYSPGAMQPTPTPDVPGYGNQGQNFGREQTYFRPQYTPIGAEQAKSIYGFANGGPVEAMSNANAIGANTGYPQADIRTGAYATPYQQPMAQNVVTGAQDAAVNPYTGQMAFADGGSVGGYTYDPATQTYVKAGGQGITSVKPAGFDEQTQSGQGTAEAPPGGWSSMTPSEQAAYYGANPMMAAITQGLQTGFGMTSMGALQNAMNPGFAAEQSGIAHGYGSSYGGASQAEADAMSAAMSSSSTGAGNPGESAGDAGPSGEGTASGGDGYAHGGLSALAQGGVSNLGSYSDGGRLLRGPGDGISDSIPATIGNKRPARLADGEFVVPARIVSELGNGSTEAGARKLYAMMDRVQKSRGKTVGKGKVATNSRAYKHLPA